jgi:hypothetical protein
LKDVVVDAAYDDDAPGDADPPHSGDRSPLS